jgi:lipid-A-disaccharide synthase-like uncharacterized protein
MEVLSTIASCLVLVTYCVKNQKIFRTIAIVSGIMFLVYAIVLGLPSMIFMNGSCLVINSISLIKIIKKEKKNNFIVRNIKVA